MKNKIKIKSGFTVVEMLIAMFIFILIGIAIVEFYSNISFLNKVGNDNLIAQEDLRKILKTMSTEIRSMSASDTGAYALLEVASSSLTFYSNIDDDNLTERIRYFLDNTTLKKGILKPSGSPAVYNTANETLKILAENMANNDTPIFTYYDTDYDGTGEALTEPINISLIRLIKIDILIDEDPNKLPASLFMTTQVNIRNLKDNL